MTTGSFQRLLFAVATLATLASCAAWPPASIALDFESGSSFALSHAPASQSFGGFVPAGSTQGAFVGSGYEEWVEALAEQSEVSQAGGHPDSTISFQLTGSSTEPDGSTKDIVIELPPGAIANPSAVPACEAADFNLTLFGRCPTETQVGVTATDAGVVTMLSPLSRLIPSPGEAMLTGFKVVGISVLVHPRVGTESDYGFTIETRDIPTTLALAGVALTLWGIPYHPAHDSHRFDTDLGVLGASVPGPVRPLASSPTSCETGSLHTSLQGRSWGSLENWFSEEMTAAPQTGCAGLDFDPEVRVEPTSDLADSPTGLAVDIRIPQNTECEAGPPIECGLAVSHLKDTTITLPEGMALNPSGANGLVGCSSAEIGLSTPPGSKPIHFTGEPANCPDAARIGTAEVETPLLEEPLRGAVYIAEPHDNPFASLLAIYIEVAEPQRGIVAKFGGKVVADPATGQLTTTMQEAPQLPIEHIRLNLKQGPHAALHTPSSCGNYSSTAQLTPYSAPTESVALHDEWSISGGPAGSCDRSKALSFDAGTIRPIAGVYSPLVLRLNREDGTQDLESLAMHLPAGLTASIGGIQACPEIALASLGSDPLGVASQPGREPGLCPASSRIGSAFLGVGAGPSPYFLDQGPIYLAGPYRGAPLSLVIVVPARAGPFDLGTVIRRAAVFIDRRTAGATVVSDPLPRILRGIPISYRTLHLTLDRPGLIRNPTSCEPTKITATATSKSGINAELGSRFQVADCAALPFRPRLALHFSGGVGRNAHPAVRAVLRSRGVEAGIKDAAFTLPPGELLDIHQVRALCPRALAPERCPRDSGVGRARIWSPLLDAPLQGPIYLREPGRRLPDLLADLHNGLFQVLLQGPIATPRGRLRVRLRALPDVPISRAVFTLAGGRRGIIVNSEGLCGRHPRAMATLSAHNGMRYRTQPRVLMRGC